MSTEATRRDQAVITPPDICEILVTRTGVDPGTFRENDLLTLTELDIDSLAVLELQAVIVERHGVEIPAEAITMNVHEIAAFVNGSVEKVG
jgi:acyl carrier protein